MTSQPADSAAELDVLVVGAGFSGLHLLHRLRGDGYSVRVLESAPEVGGTWYWNRYPGARCDVESVDYSYSWDDDLQQEWEWTEKYPAQGDILAYLKHVADRFDLRKDIELETTVTGATWDESAARWTVRTEDGRQYVAQFLVMAVGCLSVPKEVDLPGLEHFGGQVLRTWDWPEEADLTGRDVCVIGTGSTGAQVVPALAEVVGRLTVVQRTPNFVIPTRNRPLEEGELEAVKAEYPERRRRNISHPAGVFRSDNPKNAMEVDAAERHATFQERWEGGGINFLGSFADLMFDEAANDAICSFVHEKIEEIVEDQKVAELLKPDSYPWARSDRSSPPTTTRPSTARTSAWSTCARPRWRRSPSPGWRWPTGSSTTSTPWSWPPASTPSPAPSPRWRSAAATGCCSATSGRRRAPRPSWASPRPGSPTC